MSTVSSNIWMKWLPVFDKKKAKRSFKKKARHFGQMCDAVHGTYNADRCAVTSNSLPMLQPKIQHPLSQARSLQYMADLCKITQCDTMQENDGCGEW